MKYRNWLLMAGIALLSCSHCVQSHAGEIYLPMVPVIEEPDAPKPVDPTVPKVVPDIRAGELYLIGSDDRLRMHDSRQGLVNIIEMPGPVTFYFNKFSDGLRTKTETRTKKEPWVYVLQAAEAGEVEIIMEPVGVLDSSQTKRIKLAVVMAPRPPPEPVDPVEPEPVIPEPVDPINPNVPSKLQVLIIEDPARTTAQQAAIFDSAAVRKYLADHCSMTGNQRDYLKISVNQDVSDQAAWVKEAFAIPRPSVPFMVVFSKTKKTSGVLPPSIDETLKALKLLGGE
jgi:hypothetical protein